MSSFQFADYPTELILADQPRGQAIIREGDLSATIRNTSDRRQTARIALEPLEGDASPEWFRIGDAPSTNPQIVEIDFEANATQTVSVKVAIPPDATPDEYSFRLTITSEADPDNDFTTGPAVRLVVPPPPDVKQARPVLWWIVGVAAAVVVVVVAVLLLVLPDPPELVDVVGDTPEIARERLVEAGFAAADIGEEDGPPVGEEPGTVAKVRVSNGGWRAILIIDPGVEVPTSVVDQPFEQAEATLTDRGLNVVRVERIWRGAPQGTVVMQDPEPGEPVRLGAEIVLTVATTTEPEPECDDVAAEFVMGEVLTDTLIDQAQGASGADTVRVIRPGDDILLDFRADRLNLEVDESNLVVGVTCG